jgi:hypothetical protein
MGDIYIGLAVMLTLAVMMFFLGRKIAQRLSPRVGKLLAVGRMIAAGLNVVFLRESVLLARLLRFSNLKPASGGRESPDSLDIRTLTPPARQF